MYPIMFGATILKNEARRDTALRTYARLEYGVPDAAWLTVTEGSIRGDPRERLKRRVRHWINSFRGFAIDDIRGLDDRART